MKVLITGITGFVGGHLAERLLSAGGYALVGVSRNAFWPSNLEHLANSVELVGGDLLDAEFMESLLRRVRPDWIFHLAGYANTGKSFHEAEVCWESNLTGTRRLYDSILNSNLQPRILFASTGLVYGDPDPNCQDLNEYTSLKPASPYAASKAAADLLSYQMARHPGLDVVRVRLFNQIGPRQATDYAVANFARQVAAVEAGQQPPALETGDLSAFRDLTDVRDMVDAMHLLLKCGGKGEVYNAGSGQVSRMRDVLQSLVGLAKVPVTVKEKPAPGRTTDATVSRANPTKLKSLTGWKPRFELSQTLEDVLNYWRKEVR